MKNLLICLIAITLSQGLLLAQRKSKPSTLPYIQITKIEQTPLFPKRENGGVIREVVKVYVDNQGKPLVAGIKVSTTAAGEDIRSADSIAKGQSVINVLVPDVSVETPITIVLSDNKGKELASGNFKLIPQKKWTLYCTSYSHQDLGYGDYPHRIRTSIRHENIRLPLRFCSETDSLPYNDRYRFNVETSEPITSFISFLGKDAANELAGRMREGRILLGGLHNTSNTEELSHELMSRLFYMSGRHAVDLLGVAPNKTILNDDVIGLTWPLATYGAEAGLSYFFHGYNGCGHCLVPAESEPVFYWEGPDGRDKLLMRSIAYGGYAGDNTGNGTEKDILASIAKLGAGWPYDVLLLQEGTDFQLATRKVADQIHTWNSKYAWPRMISSTMDMYFNAMAAETKPGTVKTYALDSNNQWSDQDYAAARGTGEARRLTELLPETETLASIAQVLAGGGDQWIDIFQGYHRLLQYFEHTNSKDLPSGNLCWYETELEENREMVKESEGYQKKVLDKAEVSLNAVLTRTGKNNLVVFNSLPYKRRDIVRTTIPAGFVPVDEATGKKIPLQKLPDGTSVFIASELPSAGIKTFRLESGKISPETKSSSVLESKFYRIDFDKTTGVLTSIFDKRLGVELIEKDAPHGFNEYLYEFRANTQGVDYNSTISHMGRADSIMVTHGPVSDVLVVTGKAEGVKKMVQTVILYHDLPRIDFSIMLDKLPFAGTFGKQHEAVFIAMPFNIPGFSIHHELPGAVIEPYKQQFDGSNTAHYAIRSFSDLSNEKYGITVSTGEGSLVCYGEPTSSPMLLGNEYNFRRDRKYPDKSRLYLYLLNNMFDVNIAADQPGPVNFSWSLCSHEGDWKTGEAVKFGRSIQQPVLSWCVDGKNKGTIGSDLSFLSIDAPNVMMSVLKMAESNGNGLILRLNETEGKDTEARISLPMLNIRSVNATSLTENDKEENYPVSNNSFRISIPKFGVRTVRIICESRTGTITDIKAEAVADMRVDLKWKCDAAEISHFNIYRDTREDCLPTQINFIGQSSAGSFSDYPKANIGGWIRNCPLPGTRYFYRIVPVDRTNNSSAPGALVSVTTLRSDQNNLSPVKVEGVRPVLVSHLSDTLNYVNLLFRTSCEPDITGYEIYRSVVPSSAGNEAAPAGMVRSNDIPVRSGGYGESKILYVNSEYDHATFRDSTVLPAKTYYYKIRAVDSAGQKGEFSDEVSIRTKPQ